MIGLLALLLWAPVAAADMVYGRDHPGADYNVTRWSSPPSAAANHYEASALACEALCAAAAQCCAWTYVPPQADGGGERCCLKDAVPDPIVQPYWTGVKNASGKCAPPPPPPFPGPAWVVPTVHNSPLCTHLPNWHDVAGALYFRGFWHVFQGSAACNGVKAGWCV